MTAAVFMRLSGGKYSVLYLIQHLCYHSPMVGTFSCSSAGRAPLRLLLGCLLLLLLLLVLLLLLLLLLVLLLASVDPCNYLPLFFVSCILRFMVLLLAKNPIFKT